MKFTPAGGRVAAEASLLSEEVLVAVHDTGIGIAPEEQATIFEEFRQASRHEAVDQEGTGLGLALAKQLVEMHGGRIWVESKSGVGSTFTFALPVPQRTGAADTLRERPNPSPDPDIPTVLVIEDDPKAAELLSVYLLGAGLHPIVCSTGQEGIEAATRTRPQTIILDILLPDQDGWDVLTELKARPATSGIPVVITTSVDERGRGLALGASDYLLKPIDRTNLLKSLRRATEGTRNENGPLTVLAIDDDPMALELTSAVLSPEGFDVLRAGDGLQGLEAARREKPALIILDLLMPGMDGFAVLEALRSEEELAAIPVIVLTGQSLNSGDRERLNSRVRHLAAKSDFDRTSFVSLIRNLCNLEEDNHGG